eukprot:scaffold2363_cov159-Pinguiococcus_pyrenoidosus.AAC.6
MSSPPGRSTIVRTAMTRLTRSPSSVSRSSGQTALLRRLWVRADRTQSTRVCSICRYLVAISRVALAAAGGYCTMPG